MYMAVNFSSLLFNGRYLQSAFLVLLCSPTIFSFFHKPISLRSHRTLTAKAPLVSR